MLFLSDQKIWPGSQEKSNEKTFSALMGLRLEMLNRSTVKKASCDPTNNVGSEFKKELRKKIISNQQVQ